MTEVNAPATLTTPAGTVSFNVAAAGNDFFCTDITGLDGAPLRAPVDEAPQTPGGIVYPAIKGPRYLVVEGLLLPGYGLALSREDKLAARNDMEAELDTALQSIEAADGTWSWTPTGGSLRTLTVQCDISASYPNRGQNTFGGGFLKGFIFGLVAANPTIG